MSDTTNIDDLPSNESANVKIENTQTPVQPQPQQYQANTNDLNNNSSGVNTTMLSPEDINKIISGIQEASKQNQTGLPVRDIPMVSSQISQDPTVSPNYIPGENTKDYIQNSITHSDVYENIQYNKHQEQNEQDVFEQYKVPIIIAILFLIFQMPVIDKKLYKFIPSLFNTDKDLTFNGFAFKAALFGGIYFGLIRAIDYLL